MRCELCGKEDPLYKAVVEGTAMSVCKGCGKFGKVLSAPVPQQKKAVQHKEEAPPDIVDDFAQKIRGAREKIGLTQKEFALKVSEKESLLSKLETGAVKPSLPLAQKLERLLKIKLVQEQTEGVVEKHQKTGVLTIGDIIKPK